ncbi:hypothetical protein D3Z32_06270 [Bifidobacterium pseudolongum]|nr:hypothetical protein [Bifidobacterium pseudolongum]
MHIRIFDSREGLLANDIIKRIENRPSIFGGFKQHRISLSGATTRVQVSLLLLIPISLRVAQSIHVGIQCNAAPLQIRRLCTVTNSFGFLTATKYSPNIHITLRHSNHRVIDWYIKTFCTHTLTL